MSNLIPKSEERNMQHITTKTLDLIQKEANILENQKELLIKECGPALYEKVIDGINNLLSGFIPSIQTEFIQHYVHINRIQRLLPTAAEKKLLSTPEKTITQKCMACNKETESYISEGPAKHCTHCGNKF